MHIKKYITPYEVGDLLKYFAAGTSSTPKICHIVKIIKIHTVLNNKTSYYENEYLLYFFSLQRYIWESEYRLKKYEKINNKGNQNE